MAEVQVKSLKSKHHAMIDWLLANPGKAFGILADNMSVSRSWLSIVMHSDVFVEEYTRRRMAHSSELSRQLVEKQLTVALKAYDRLEDIIDDVEVEDRLVLDAADKTAKLLGFSPSAGTGPNLRQVEESVEREVTREVAPGVLEKARETLRRVTTEGNINALPAPEG